MQENKGLPKATKKRLLQLLHLLEAWQNEKIKSGDIAELLSCKDSSVRHDIFLAGFGKGVSNGYSVIELRAFLEKLFGFETTETDYDECKKCCIVGLGRLGAALLDDSIFQDSGFRVGCGFDSSVNRVEILRSTFPLYPAFEMEAVLKKEKIEYAVLCVSEKDAHKRNRKHDADFFNRPARSYSN